MPIVLAIDPDTRTPAFACIEQEAGVFRFLFGGCGHVTGEEEPAVAAAKALAQALDQHPNAPHPSRVQAIVEGQAIYPGSKAKPQHILGLAFAAGACLGMLMTRGYQVRSVAPAAWKGQVPKHVCQGRAYATLGWDYRVTDGQRPFALPADQRDIRRADWKHVGDAVALALWGLANFPPRGLDSTASRA